MSFRRLRENLLRGEDLDAYITIVAAIVVAFLSLFDVLSLSKTISLTLAVLAILAFNALTTRIKIGEAIEKDFSKLQFHSEFPQELRAHRESSDNVYLIGVDLARTIESSFGAFDRSLRKGGTIRVLLTDPTADDAAIDARTQISYPDISDMRSGIRASLRRLAKLNAAGPGRLEVRLTRSALKFGLNYVDVGGRGTTMYVQLYSVRLPGESRPMFKLTLADGEWFECYRIQAEALWDEGQSVDLGAVT